MTEYNIERSPEFVGSVARTGMVTGRKCDYAAVTLVDANDKPQHRAEFAWSTIASALNNNRALRL